MAKQPDLRVKVRIISSKGNNLYEVLGEDNKTYDLYVSASKTAPEDGDTILAYTSDKVPGTYNFFAVDSKASSSSSGGSSDDYWKSKYNYEVNIRDKDIRLQRWTGVFLNAASVAAANGLDLVSGNTAASADDLVRWSITGAKSLIESLDKSNG